MPTLRELPAKIVRRLRNLPEYVRWRNAVRREHLKIAEENRRIEQEDRRSLIILDDCFPNLLTAFRIAEFNTYLETFPDAIVYTTASAMKQTSFEQDLEAYAKYYPGFTSRIQKFHPARKLHGVLAYFTFVQNIAVFIDAIEQNGIPFVFQLYPGGRFQFNDPDSDTQLRRVLSSPCFRKVIVTQNVVYDYLVAHKFCAPEQIEFIFGVVLPMDQLTRERPVKQRYPTDKATFDLCFVAHKYTERGIDKGYDVFIECAKYLCRTREDIRFHVVGPFSESDIDVGDIRDKITFYGSRQTNFFPDFYSRMDVVLSPNVPFVHLPGAFDGFPTGACTEAGLCGVAIFCTDPLKMNVAFEDGKELVIIPHDADEICKQITFYINNVAALYAIAEQGRRQCCEVYHFRGQMEPRLRILQEQLQNCPA